MIRENQFCGNILYSVLIWLPIRGLWIEYRSGDMH